MPTGSTSTRGIPTFEPGTDGPVRKRRRPNWLGWTLAIVVLVGCTFFLDLEELLSGLRRLGPGEIALLVLISTADRVLMGIKWWHLLGIAGVKLPLLQVVRIFYQGSFAGVFLPSHVGGDVLRAYWASEASGAPHHVLASLIVERLLGMVCAINVAVAGGMVYAAMLMPERPWLWIAGGALMLVGISTAFALAMSSRVHAFVLRHLARHRRFKLAETLHRFYEAYASFGADKQGLAANALLTLLEQMLQMMLIYGIALALGITAQPVAFLAATALYMFVIRIPVAPDGWGIGELTAIGIYALIDTSTTDAFSISIIGHIIPMLALAPGFLFLLRGSPEPPAAEARRF
ncbi:lysylphosphatidylglycerol synthase transmembrane domain-containing protein [Benzoatithermus flavus]